MKFRRFTKPQFLQGIGRELLAQLFGRFTGEFTARQQVLPADSLEDEPYFKALAALAMAPDGLPDRLIETLFAIEELATSDGYQRLVEASALAGIELSLRPDSSHADAAVQAWLTRPELLAATHNQLRIGRLAAFEYFGSKSPVDRSDAMAAPDRGVLNLLEDDLNTWCRHHQRGEKTAHVDAFTMEGEFCFLVRHGDTFARKPTAAGEGRVRILHFRPAKDDVVVYSPERDEIRINAGTKGERELYRCAFGRRLFQDAEYFSEHQAYTLEPLRHEGADALSTEGVPGLRRVVLHELEIARPRGSIRSIVLRGKNLLALSDQLDDDPLRIFGQFVRAVFDFHFEGVAKPRRVELRPPNVLKLGRHCDARLVHLWLGKRSFRGRINAGKENPTYV